MLHGMPAQTSCPDFYTIWKIIWQEEWLVGATHSTWNFGSNWPHWSANADFRSIFAHSASAITPVVSIMSFWAMSTAVISRTALKQFSLTGIDRQKCRLLDRGVHTHEYLDKLAVWRWRFSVVMVSWLKFQYCE